MAIDEFRLGDQLVGPQVCPHCGVARPLLGRVWQSSGEMPRADGGACHFWFGYACTSCGGLVTVKAKGMSTARSIRVVPLRMYPDVWAAEPAIPETARRYLNQANNTLGNPDASVIMSASAIDAMLKQQGLSEGSLFKRIDQAVVDGIITSAMAQWAHRVRLDANNPRHADRELPHMSLEDAERALDFAKALAEILFVLPQRMPEKAG